MISLILFLLVVVATFYRPAIGLALVSQIYLLRSLIHINSAEICFKGECMISNSPMFGLILPLLVFTITIMKLILVNNDKKIRYKFDLIDWVIIFYIFVMLLGCIYSLDIINSIEYFSKFILLGISYFFVTKLYLYNTKNKIEFIRHLFLTIYLIGVILSIIATYYFVTHGGTSIRLTLPGAHPIPFSLLIGQSLIISIAILLSKGKLLEITNKFFLNINIPIAISLLIIQFATNTRGVTISLIIALLLLLLFSRDKLSIKRILFFIPPIIAVLGYLITKIGADVLFSRFITSSGSVGESISERIVAYTDSIKIFSDNIFLGSGTDTFSHLSTLDYPHNLFLENVASFGSLGLLINIGFVSILGIAFIKIAKCKRPNYMFVVLYVLTVFFFIETMFSFTIWMHKGLYLHLALLSCHSIIRNKDSYMKLNNKGSC